MQLEFQRLKRNSHLMTSDTAKLWITFDFELGWGVVENQRWITRERAGVYERLHALFGRLLETLEEHEIPVCWATVGAMSQSINQYDWDYLPQELEFKLVNFCNESKDTTRDGRALIDSLLATKHQKIVSHSYSHAVYTADYITNAQVLDDLNKVKEIMALLNGSASTMVLPENRIPEIQLLKKAGVDTIRLPPEYRASRLPRLMEKLFWHPSAADYCHESIKYFPGSMLFKPRGDDIVSQRAFELEVAGLKCQLKRGVSQHIWLHPFNFGEYDKLLSAFEKFIHWAAYERDKGTLQIGCMSD